MNGVRRFEENGIPLKSMVSNWSILREIFARRNIMVHNGGRTDRRYEVILKENGTNLTDIPVRGSRLDVSLPYLHESLQTMVTFATNLTISTSARFRPDEMEDHATWLKNRQEDMLHYGFWRSVIETSEFPRKADCSRSLQISIEINRWISMLELGLYSKLTEEVERWDTSGLDLRYSHARSVLLREEETALGKIHELLDTGKITIAHVLSHPLYHQLRVSGGLANLISSRKQE